MGSKRKIHNIVIAAFFIAAAATGCSPRPEEWKPASSGYVFPVQSAPDAEGPGEEILPEEPGDSTHEPVSEAESVPDYNEGYEGAETGEEAPLPVSGSESVPPDPPIFIIDSEYGPDIDAEAVRYLPPSRDTDEAVDLSIPYTFNITRPTQKIKSTDATYFITGTSDPDIPLFFGDEEIERQGVTGVFGVHVELDMGENIFTFSQGGTVLEAVIAREPEKQTTAIDYIVQGSMFPAVQGGAKAGGSITARCVAPSGAIVTAEFGGSTARLVQSAQASEGIPAVYTGYLSAGEDYGEDVTERIGPITYTLEYKGKKTVYKSSGDMFVAGKSSMLALEVISYAGFIYMDTSGAYNFKEKVKGGARDYIAGQDNAYFELASGGFIPVDAAVIVEGMVKVANSISSPLPEFLDDREIYSLESRFLPMYFTSVTEEAFLITLYNTSGAPGLDASPGRLFSSVKTQRGQNSVTYEFAFKDRELLWGYDISFDGDKLAIMFKYRPQLSHDPEKPLEGITVLLDPGHGGSDPGALGVPGITGPSESAVNLAHAYIIRDRLGELGAEVLLTRAGDSWLHLDSRLRMIDEFDADVFISLHHNSIGVSADANKPSGMEVYYHTDFSKEFAEGMMDAFALGVNRNNRFVRYANYRVTLMPYAPSILAELGFLSNPLEYERITNPLRMRQIADATAEGLYRLFRG